MTATIVPPNTTPARPTAGPIPITRLVKVEMRKMFDTRSGFWMLVILGIYGLHEPKLCRTIDTKQDVF